jgi:hypothetical protein
VEDEMGKTLEERLNTIKLEKLKRQLDDLTDDERHELFSSYCPGCGAKELPCFCERDD